MSRLSEIGEMRDVAEMGEMSGMEEISEMTQESEFSETTVTIDTDGMRAKGEMSETGSVGEMGA